MRAGPGLQAVFGVQAADLRAKAGGPAWRHILGGQGASLQASFANI